MRTPRLFLRLPALVPWTAAVARRQAGCDDAGRKSVCVAGLRNDASAFAEPLSGLVAVKSRKALPDR